MLHASDWIKISTNNKLKVPGDFSVKYNKSRRGKPCVKVSIIFYPRSPIFCSFGSFHFTAVDNKVLNNTIKLHPIKVALRTANKCHFIMQVQGITGKTEDRTSLGKHHFPFTKSRYMNYNDEAVFLVEKLMENSFF